MNQKSLSTLQMKWQRLFRPKFSKVKTSVIFQMQQIPNTLTLSEGVSELLIVACRVDKRRGFFVDV